MIKKILISLSLIVCHEAISEGVEPYNAGSYSIRTPSESQAHNILSGRGAVEIQASCQNVSYKNIGSGLLGNISESLDTIKDSIFADSTGIMLLSYSSPRLYVAMQQLRQATDFTMSLSTATCNDIEEYMKKGVEKDIADQKAECMAASGGSNANCGTGLFVGKGVEKWLKKKDEFLDDWVDRKYSLGGQAMEFTGYNGPNLPNSIIKKGKDTDSSYSSSEYKCNDKAKNYALSSGNISDCSVIDLTVMGYPILYSKGNSQLIIPAMFTPEQLYKELYEYYQNIFSTINNDKSKLAGLLKEHQEVVKYPQISNKTINKIASTTGASKIKEIVVYQSTIMARNHLQVYIAETEQRVAVSLNQTDASKIVGVDMLDDYNNSFANASLKLNSYFNGIVISEKIN